MGVAGYHFHPCHCILSLLKVEVQSGLFREGVEEILKSVFYSSHLVSGNKRELDGRRPRRKGIVLSKSSVSGKWVPLGAWPLEFKNQQIL